MTPEQIDMLKRLKAPIDKYMGEWKVGDKALYGKFECVLTQIKRKEKYLYFQFDDEQNFLSKDDESFVNEHFLRVPPLCTPDGKRCLWGMITNVEWKLLINRPTKEDGLQCRYSDNLQEIYADDPYTALLKALCAQEGL